MTDAPWWLRAADSTWPRDVDMPSAVARALAGLLDDSEVDDWLQVASAAIAHLCQLPLQERDRRLSRIAQAHGPESLRPEERAAVPPLLWERCRQGPAAPATLMPSPEPEAPALGCRRGRWIEWWGHAESPGARYGDELWAWGQVSEQLGLADPAALSPRLAWAPGEAGWHVHGALVPDPQLPVPLDAGPGPLLAAVVDALAEVARALETGSAALTRRESAAVFGTLLLPLLATTQVGLPPAEPEELPDYVQQLAFHLLHPRARVLLLALDRIATWKAIEDRQSVALVLEGLGRDANEPWEGLEALLDDLAVRVLHRGAGPRWDSGLGFKLVRSILRDERDGADVDTLFHAAVESSSDAAVGSLAHRLRKALQTAVAFKGRPVHPGGPAVQQVADLALLRWLDDSFLAG